MPRPPLHRLAQSGLCAAVLLLPALPAVLGDSEAFASPQRAAGGGAAPEARRPETAGGSPGEDGSTCVATAGGPTAACAGSEGGAGLATAEAADHRPDPASPTTGTVVKDKAVLLALELFPPAWLLGLDRFYLGCFRTGIAKLLVSVLTLSVGGFVWGLIDFGVVVLNALRKQKALTALGMDVVFNPGTLDIAFWMGLADVLLLPAWYFVFRYLRHIRKLRRMRLLREAALKSPHFKAPAAAAATKSG